MFLFSEMAAMPICTSLELQMFCHILCYKIVKLGRMQQYPTSSRIFRMAAPANPIAELTLFVNSQSIFEKKLVNVEQPK